MQLLSAHNLSLTFVTDNLFRDISFSVGERSRIGLVGMNGSGKTTLMKIITGGLTPSSGSLTRARDCRIAYLEQFLAADESDTLYQVVEQVFAPLIALEAELDAIAARLLEGADQQLISDQARLSERFADAGGYSFRSRVRGALLGLGFSEADFSLPLSALSGGQRSKAALAKVLLTPAELMLLDEPTNHLDVDSVRWLESYLASYKGAFILISHDRYFLDQACEETWAMHHHSLHRYKGNYSSYLEQRAAAEESVAHRYSHQVKEIRRIEGIIEQQRRFNQARNYITIASKQKQLERLRADLVAPEKAERTLGFNFNSPPPGGHEVLEAAGLSKSFGDNHLFSAVNLCLNKGERVFLIGPNGCGKSTLMKIILGREAADSGYVRLGVNIFPAYYDQLHHALAGEETVLEHFTNAYPRLTQTQIRTMLGSFLFSGETVGKTLDMLSGGEKARLELMKLIMQPANLLLLDEPTNHLDAESVLWLEQHLASYEGAILAVTHDRYFLDHVAEWICEVDRGRLYPYEGNYSTYLEKKQERLQVQGKKDAKLAKRLRDELEWVRQNAKGRQAKSKARLSRYEEMAAEAERTRKLDFEEIQIPAGPRLGSLVLEATDLSKGFGDRQLIGGLSFTLPRNGIVGVIGPNGVGKTTLFKTIVGLEPLDGGELKIGETVKIAYVDQGRGGIDPKKTLWEVVSDGLDFIKVGNVEIPSRAYVASFGFKGPDQQKPAGVLSGGERNRLNLALTLKLGGNLLLLDEPTNDLDVETLGSLENALLEFPGCAVVVSHDRWFLDRVATHILAYEGTNENPSNWYWFEGNFAAYEENKVERLGADAARPHRVTYRKLTRD